MEGKSLSEQSEKGLWGAVTVAMEMRSVFPTVFGETLIGRMTNVANMEWTRTPKVGDI